MQKYSFSHVSYGKASQVQSQNIGVNDNGSMYFDDSDFEYDNEEVYDDI